MNETIAKIKNDLEDYYHNIESQSLQNDELLFNEREIVEALIQELTNNNNLECFVEALSILDLIDKIFRLKGKTYKNYHQDLHDLLIFHLEKIEEFIKMDTINYYPQLDQFFHQYSSHPKIKSLVKSGPHTLKEITEKIEEQHAEFDKFKQMKEKELSQITYSQLLTDVLEGNQPQTLLPTGLQKQKELRSGSTFLPNTEFEVPSLEPENPAEIGINRTMSFNPQTTQRTLFELFSTKELIKDYLSAFPWGITVSALRKLSSAKHQSGVNLVGTDIALEPQIQLEIMRNVLVSLDALGKAAGKNGEIAIKNYQFVHKISMLLQKAAKVVEQIDEEQDAENVDELNKITNELTMLNQAFFDNLYDHEAEHPMHNNVLMNEFCHINERITHKLLGLPFTQSCLTPLELTSPHYHQIMQAAKEPKRKPPALRKRKRED